MKYLSILLCSLILVACGGGDETPVAIIKTSVPHPAAKAATVSGGSGVAIHMYQALYGMAPSNATLSAHTAQATSDPSVFARTLTSSFASTSNTALAKLVLDNLGVTAATVTAVSVQGKSEYAILLDALGQMFAFYGLDARGQIILNATNLFAGLESDTTYGATATSYNNQSTANFSYSSKPANTVAAAISTATANAGATQDVEVGTLVTLDGTSSRADLGRTLTYAWALTSRPAGSSASLLSYTSARPTFTPDVTGTYVVSLTVNDGKANSTAAMVRITAAVANAAPIANAGVAQSVVAGSVVTLDGGASSDPDNDPLTFAWTLTAKPSGSAAVISPSTSAKPSYTADLAGTYVASLTVSDGQATSTAATVYVTATVANVAPVANAGIAQTATAGNLVTLDGSSSSDANGEQLTFNWTLTSKPSGSSAVLSSATSVKPTFTGDVAGTYIATLIVNDGTVNSAAATVSTTVVSALAPTVTMVATTLGPVGQNVYVYGTNFVVGQTTVNMGGLTSIQATVTATFSLQFVVPSGATGSGPITVVTPNGSATSSESFTVGAPSVAPTVTSFSPSGGPVGQWNYVYGTNFVFGQTTISMGGVTSISAYVYSPESLGFAVPAGATGSGPITVVTQNGSASSSTIFKITAP